MLSVTDRVSRGAELLDREVPGWAGRIAIDDLDMNDCEECILGQIFGHFAEGVHVLGISDCADGLGFDISGDECMNYITMRTYSHLVRAWIAEIERRLGVVRT